MKTLKILAACAVLAGAAPPALAQYNTRLLADSDRDGKVTLTEYQGSRRAYLMKADRDGDGKVTRAEWDKRVKIVKSQVALDGVEGADKIGKGGWFEMIDADKDQVITPAEIDAMTETRFAKLDLNADGSVDRREGSRLLRMTAAQ